MIVRQIKVGRMENFVYLFVDEVSREGLVIDSGWEISPILEAAKKENAKIKFVVATHAHFDHINSIQKLADETGAEILVHEYSPLEGGRRLRDGDELRLGEAKVSVLHTPGHTEDSICLHGGGKIFTGDTLFIGSCGRTDLQGGSSEKLFRSLHYSIRKLPGETIIYPGHDYGEVPNRSLREEERLNPALRAESLEKFLRLLS